MREDRRPIAVMMSKRANVFYLEHVRLIQKDGRLMYLTETGQPVEKIVNIPDKNTALILLGKGTSITDAAARKLAESNIMLGFCGSGGSPLYGAVDITFIVPQDEYRPTEYMQAWARMWFDENKRIGVARMFLAERLRLVEEKWNSYDLPLPVHAIEGLKKSISGANSTTDLLSAEALYAKGVYAHLARLYRLEFVREEGKRSKLTPSDTVNSYLDHGNYIAYGYASCALHTLGVSFAFPVLHGKTRRGALVFDVADLVKDWLVMPLAFEYGAKMKPDNQFRAAVIERAQEEKVLDLLMTLIKAACEKCQ
ncbi:type I-F CRISPR-associated endonuclease Cas1f [Pelomicrobium methylotrophicum]|uniref:CRISPR-associated endonuclease Cas1 n=1 Tax=Pelomicrobium methylotrophicum TaxID=2602750 RepID=A0A5C7EP97_9PROT|nr:type I-F CRISPR-associated endonuclease Cas1f [Pelomicrobium methylotrophicum]TXF10352.1 type I-F CRISPR-associated endonuclease Cas1 [Pelomicrobium methylotrophicum]